MKKMVAVAVACMLILNARLLRAAPLFTSADVAASSTASVGGPLWDETQTREIMTPTPGESETARLIHNVSGPSGSGVGDVETHLSLNPFGLDVRFDHEVSLTLGSAGSAAATSTGTAMAEYTLNNVRHDWRITGGGIINGPANPDDQTIGIDISLKMGDAEIVNFHHDGPGSFTVDRRGFTHFVVGGSMSFSATITNSFAYNAAAPGNYGSNALVFLEFRAFGVPEGAASIVMAQSLVGLCALRKRRHERGVGGGSSCSRGE